MRTITPRAWQTAALGKWAPEMRGVVAAVTGAGKTTFATLCAQEFLRRHPDGRLLVLAPTTALADQWCEGLSADLGIELAEVAAIFGGQRAWGDKKVVVAVLDSARRLSESISSEGPTMLVVDECHRAGAEKNSLALRGSYVATLGLSATPERQHDDGFEERVVPVLGPIIHEYGYREAHADGVIADFDLANVEFELLPHEREEYERFTKRIARLTHMVGSGSASEESLHALLRQRAAVSTNSPARIPIAAHLAMRHRSDRVIVFHESVAVAQDIAEILRKRDVLATMYHTGLPPEVRRENLRLYRRGAFNCMVCCRALDEGLDVPDTSVAIVAGSTSSTRQRIQRLGRVLRKRPGKDSALIYTLHGTEVEKARLKEEEEEMKGVASVKWYGTRTASG